MKGRLVYLVFSFLLIYIILFRKVANCFQFSKCVNFDILLTVTLVVKFCGRKILYLGHYFFVGLTFVCPVGIRTWAIIMITVMISVQQQTAQKYQTHLSPKSIRTKFFENGTLSKVFHTKPENPNFQKTLELFYWIVNLKFSMK